MGRGHRGGRELLLTLLATPEHRLSRDQVLDALWPTHSPGSARNAYYKALHSLRRTLEPALPPWQEGRFVWADSEALGLQAGAFEVDDFLLLIEAYAASGQHDLAHPQYEHCAALRDDLGVEPSDATVRAAARLQHLRSGHAASRPQRSQSLPVPPNRLIGREAELERIYTSLLDAGVRLLTLLRDQRVLQRSGAVVHGRDVL
jgi:DNA-binding SARP family transcriptional activator